MLQNNEQNKKKFPAVIRQNNDNDNNQNKSTDMTETATINKRNTTFDMKSNTQHTCKWCKCMTQNTGPLACKVT